MSTKRRRRIRRPPARETLSFDLLLDIIVRSDFTTVARCAVTCRVLRRAILDPAFGRRLTLQAAAGFQFDPALLLAVSYFESHRHRHARSKTSKCRLIHTPVPTQRRTRLDFDSISYGCLTPLLARGGLFLHRLGFLCGGGHIALVVGSNLTGDITGQRAFLRVGDGGSFELLVADDGIRFQIFSSKEGKWDIVREASSIPPHHPKMNLGGFSDPVVIGRTVYWICRLNPWPKCPPEWAILALDVDAAEATIMDLPPDCISRMMPYKKDKRSLQDEYLLLASVRGRLSLLIMESIGISMWTLTSAASGSAPIWNRQLVIGAAEILRQAGFVVHDNLTRTPFKLEGFGERSASVILSLGHGQLFRLDLGITKVAPLSQGSLALEVLKSRDEISVGHSAVDISLTLFHLDIASFC